MENIPELRREHCKLIAMLTLAIASSSMWAQPQTGTPRAIVAKGTSCGA